MQRLVDPRDLGAAPDEAEVAQLDRRERPQRFEVVRVAPRDDDGVRVRRQMRPRNPCGNVVDDDFLGGREALRVGELLAIVHDPHAEPDFVRSPREVEPDVARADDVQIRRRLDRLDVDVHLPAADQPRLLREIVGQLVVQQLRPAVGDRLARLPERVVLVAAAADRADDAPVGEDEHLRADALRGRSKRRDNRDERGRLAALERVGDGGEDFPVHMAIIRAGRAGGAGWERLRPCRGPGRAGRWRALVSCPDRLQELHDGGVILLPRRPRR